MFTVWAAKELNHEENPHWVAHNCLEVQLQQDPVPLASLAPVLLFVCTSTHTHMNIKNKKIDLKERSPKFHPNNRCFEGPSIKGLRSKNANFTWKTSAENS